MKSFIAAVVIAGVAILAGIAVIAGPSHDDGQSPAVPTPVLVELFTSEGCSSCPPADQLLIDLLRIQPVNGVRVIGLSEHVDYWNQLGWKDPFSDHLFSLRQSAYAATLKTHDVYTPQMVVDGGEAFVGGDRAAAVATIARAVKTPKAPVSLGWTSTTPRTLDVSFSGATPAIGATVFLAIVEDGLSIPVRAGENSGHVLAHAAVTRRLTEIGRADRTGAFTHAGVPVDIDTHWKTPALHVVVFAAAKDTRRVVAAGTIAAQK